MLNFTFTQAIDLTIDLPSFANERIKIYRGQFFLTLSQILFDDTIGTTQTVLSEDVIPAEYLSFVEQDLDVYTIGIESVLAARINSFFNTPDTKAVRITVSGILRPEIRDNPFIGNNVTARAILDEFLRSDLMLQYLRQEGITDNSQVGSLAFTDLTDTVSVLGTPGQKAVVDATGRFIEFIDDDSGEIADNSITDSKISNSLNSSQRSLFRDKISAIDLRLTGLPNDLTESETDAIKTKLNISEMGGDTTIINVDGDNTSHPITISDAPPEAHRTDGTATATVGRKTETTETTTDVTSVAVGISELSFNYFFLSTRDDVQSINAQGTERPVTINAPNIRIISNTNIDFLLAVTALDGARAFSNTLSNAASFPRFTATIDGTDYTFSPRDTLQPEATYTLEDSSIITANHIQYDITPNVPLPPASGNEQITAYTNDPPSFLSVNVGMPQLVTRTETTTDLYEIYSGVEGLTSIKGETLDDPVPKTIQLSQGGENIDGFLYRDLAGDDRIFQLAADVTPDSVLDNSPGVITLTTEDGQTIEMLTETPRSNKEVETNFGTWAENEYVADMDGFDASLAYAFTYQPSDPPDDNPIGIAALGDPFDDPPANNAVHIEFNASNSVLKKFYQFDEVIGEWQTSFDFENIMGGSGARVITDLGDVSDSFGSAGQVLKVDPTGNIMLFADESVSTSDLEGKLDTNMQNLPNLSSFQQQFVKNRLGIADSGLSDIDTGKLASLLVNTATFPVHTWNDRARTPSNIVTLTGDLRSIYMNSTDHINGTQGSPHRFPYVHVTSDPTRLRFMAAAAARKALEDEGIEHPGRYARIPSGGHISNIRVVLELEDTGVMSTDFDGVTIAGQTTNDYGEHDTVGRVKKVFLYYDDAMFEPDWVNLTSGSAREYAENITQNAFVYDAEGTNLVEDLHVYRSLSEDYLETHQLAQLVIDIQTLNDKINALEGSSVDDQITDLTTRVGENEDSIVVLDSEVSDNTDDISDLSDEIDDIKTDLQSLEQEVDEKDITGYQDPNGEPASDYILPGKLNNFLGIIGSTHFADKIVTAVEDIALSDEFEPVRNFDNQVRLVYGQPGSAGHTFREAFFAIEDNGINVRLFRGEDTPSDEFNDVSDFVRDLTFHVKEGDAKTFKLRNERTPSDPNLPISTIQSDYKVRDTIASAERTIEGGRYVSFILDPDNPDAKPLTRDDIRRGFTDIVMTNNSGEDKWFIELNSENKGVEYRDIPAVVPLKDSTLYNRLSYINGAKIAEYSHREDVWTEDVSTATEISGEPTAAGDYAKGITLFNETMKRRWFNFGDEIVDVDAKTEEVDAKVDAVDDKVDALSARIGYTDQVYKKNAFFHFTPPRRIPLSNNAPAIMSGVSDNYMISVEGVVYNKRSREIVGYFDHTFSGDDHTNYTGLHEFKDGDDTVLITSSHTSIIGSTKAIRMRAVKLSDNPTTYTITQIRAGMGEFSSINSTAINYFSGGGADASAIVARGYDVVAGLIVAKNTGNAQIPVSAVYINRIGNSDPYQLFTWRLDLANDEFHNVSADHEDAPMTIGQGAISGLISDFKDTVEPDNTTFISFIRGRRLFKQGIELVGSGQNAKPNFTTAAPEDLADVNVDRTPFSLSTDYDDNGILAQFYASDSLGIYRFTNTSTIEQVEINREDIVINKTAISNLESKTIMTDDIGNNQVTEEKLSPGVRSQLGGGGGGGGGTPTVTERGSISGIQLADTWVNINLSADVRGTDSVLNTGDVLELELRGSTAGSRNVFHLFKHTLEDLQLSSDNSFSWQTTINYKTHRGTALTSAGHESVRFKLAANNVVRIITSLAGVADLGVVIRTITRS